MEHEHVPDKRMLSHRAVSAKRRRFLDYPFPESAGRAWLAFDGAVWLSGRTAADFFDAVADGHVGVSVVRGERFFWGGDVLRLRARTAVGVVVNG